MTIAEARAAGLDTFMFTTEAARASFVVHLAGTEFTEEFHSMGDVFRLYCLAVNPRLGAGHEFIRADTATASLSGGQDNGL